MENKTAPIPPQGQLLIYQDGALRVQVRIDGKTVWLTQRLMAELYQVTVANINQHLKAIYEEGELSPEATIKQFLIVQNEGSRRVSRTVDHYNLDAILAVGYRVRSHRGTAFRQWATARLSELLVKGFTLDDERLKAGRISQQMAEERALAEFERYEAELRKLEAATPTSDFDRFVEKTRKLSGEKRKALPGNRETGKKAKGK